MKKLYITLLIILLVLFGMYFYANFKTKKNYISSFEICKEKMSKYKNELAKFSQAQECIDKGGCFETCGSGCGLPKPTINLFEMFGFYSEYLTGLKDCPAICLTGCLYPI